MPTDYIMRMIEEFFRILRNIIMKREEQDYEMARLGLDNLGRMITGLSLQQISLLGTEGIQHFFNLNKADDVEKIFCTAKMFKEEALINEAEGKKEESMNSYRFALELFELVKDKNIAEKEEVKIEINNIKNILQSQAGMADQNSADTRN